MLEMPKEMDGKIVCPSCGFLIDAATDDNYDMSHMNIHCSECGKWIFLPNEPEIDRRHRERRWMAE